MLQGKSRLDGARRPARTELLRAAGPPEREETAHDRPRSSWSFETRQIHAGTSPDPTTGARALPIYATTAYQFRDSQHAADLFALAELGNIYTRIMNPTQDALEQRVASLEGGVAALAVSSGQSATTLAILNIAEAGDHVVASASLYGGTYNLLHHTLPKLGHHRLLRRGPRRPGGVAGAGAGRTPRRSSPRRSATRRATSSTSRPSPGSRTATACR